MASIASPRAIPASGASTPTISSRRTSLDTTRTASPARMPGAQASAALHARRNRAALRDYYNLRPAAAPTDTQSSTTSVVSDDESSSVAPDSELDKPGFDATVYVQNVLGTEGLAGVLRTEGALLNEIRELDGERKALVYDNYSKLIAATDTIKGMRANMAPLGASTGQLKEMIGRVESTASELGESAKIHTERDGHLENASSQQYFEKVKRQKATVQRVVQSPLRLENLAADGKREEAEQEWDAVSKLLDKWANVKGAQEIRRVCEEILAQDSSEDEECVGKVSPRRRPLTYPL